VLDYRCSEEPFSKLSEKDEKVALDEIMLRGAANTGCNLPNTDFFANIIGEEIAIHVKEFGYQDLTAGEILLALRLNSKGDAKYPAGLTLEQVPFFGNCFNVEFLSKVLSNYMVLRNYIDRKFQNHIDGY
jgi:hypothetical protein